MQALSIFQKLKDIAHSFFLHQNQLHSSFQLLFRFIDTLIYISIINGFHLSIFKQQFDIFGALILICLLKGFLKISVGMGIYLLALQQIILFGSIVSSINMGLVVILIMSEVVGTINFDVSLPNITAQSQSHNKIYHPALLIANIIFTFTPIIYIHLASSLLFLILFLLQRRSLVKNQRFKSVSMRLLLWSSFEHLRLFLANYIYMNSETQIQIGGTFAISQLVFFIFSQIGRKINLFQLCAREQYLQLSFYLLSNYFDTTYDQQRQKFVKDLISQELQLQTYSFRDAQKEKRTIAYHFESIAP